MHKRHTTPKLFPRPLTAALAAALPALFLPHLALAACNGTVAAPNSASITLLCNNAGTGGAETANVTANDHSTYVDATNAGTVPGTPVTTANILMQFDGHGRTLAVTAGGEVGNYKNVAAARTAVAMGASTVNPSASTTFSGTALPTANSTTVTLNSAPNAAWVGQSLVIGRWLANDGGDFAPATAYVIDAVNVASKTVTLRTPLSDNFAGTGTDTMVYSVVSNYGAHTSRSWTGDEASLFGASADYHNVIDNAGLIASRVQSSEMNPAATSATGTPYAQSIYGIRSSVAGNYLVNNGATGTLRVSHAGIGAAYAVEEGGTVLRMDVRNAGLIEAIRTPSVTLTAVTATANPQGTSGGLAFGAANVGLVNAINTQEEAEVLNVFNTGTIRTQGDYSATMYMRAGEKNIVNYGLIEHKATAGGTDYTKGFAIGSVSNGGEIRELQLANMRDATINGDILAVNGQAMRWYMLSTETGLAANGRTDRLAINSQTGQENSEITNAGTIRGNIWLSNGTHSITNSGTLTGNIDVDQRDTSYTSGTASGTTTSVLLSDGVATYNTRTNGNQYTIRGDKAFSLMNTGTLTGNITVTSASSSFTPTGGNATTVNSNNVLVNAGTLTGNIVLADVTQASRTSVTLLNDGFTGAISATPKAGVTTLDAATVVLNLGGSGTLRGDVSGITTLNVGGFSMPSGDEGEALLSVGTPVWSIASGKTVTADAAWIREGSLTVAGTLAAATTIASGATLAGSGTVNGALSNAGTINVGTGTLAVNGNVTMQSGSVLKATVDANSAAGKLAVTGDLSFAAGASVRPVAASGFRITDGASYTLATASSITGLPTLQDKGLVKWQASVQNNQLIATASVKATNIANLSGNGSAALTSLVTAGGTLADRILSLDSEASVLSAAEQLKPDVKGSNVVGAMSASNAVSGVIGGRSSSVQISSLLRQSGASGISTGETADGVGLWFQAFGFNGEQRARGGQDGYGVSSGGVTLGADQLIDAQDGLRIGAAFSYAASSVGTQTTINSYQGTLYGSRELAAGYVSSELNLGRHEYAASRVVVGEIARASYTGFQYGGKLETGLPVQTRMGAVVPLASLSASRLDLDAYTESGAAGALAVGASQVHSLRSSLGAKWMLPLEASEAGSALELRASWSHEFGDARFDSTSRFVAGGASFKTTGVEQERDSLSAGAALKWSATSGGVRQSLSFGYGAEFKRGYQSHTGYVQGKVDF